MAEAKRKPSENPDKISGASYEVEGFEQIFDPSDNSDGHATSSGALLGEPYIRQQVEKLLERFTELVSISVDQRVESAKMATQIIENQRQLIATQQILIRLMERSIELTRHIGSIEERLPAVFELPRVVESMRQRLVQLEGIDC